MTSLESIGLTTLLTAEGLQTNSAPSCSRVHEPRRRMLATTCCWGGESADQRGAFASGFLAGVPLTAPSMRATALLFWTIRAIGN